MLGFADILKAILGICETDPLDPGLWSVDGKQVTVRVGQAPVLAEEGGAVYLTGQGLEVPVLIVRTGDDEFLAFANRCTHFGRKLDPVPGERKLRCCSFRHTTFDLEGTALSGPAKDPVARYETEIKDGDLLITV